MKFYQFENMKKWSIRLGVKFHITYRIDGSLKRIMINLPLIGYFEIKV